VWAFNERSYALEQVLERFWCRFFLVMPAGAH